MSQTPPSNPLTAKIADPASVDAAILNRISVRAFRPDPVPRAMLEEIISICKHKPFPFGILQSNVTNMTCT